MLANTPSRQVKSVRTAFEVIDKLQALGGATPTQLTEELELSKSTVHNYLATLKMEGYVINDEGTYRLGLRFLTHGIAAKAMVGIEQPIIRTVQSVVDELRQPTWWITEELGRGYFITNAVPDDSTDSFGIVGKRSYLHTHAPGKAILAISSDEYVKRVVDHHGLPMQTKRTTTELDVLFEEIKRVRERGFSISEGEDVLGILSIGVGFRDADDRRHAVGVFGHTRDFAGNCAEKNGELLVDEVRDLEQTLRSEGA